MFGSLRAVLLLALAASFLGCSNLPAEHTRVKAVDGAIIIPLSDVSDGMPHFYTYKHAGKRINFFVRTDGAGALSAYFDACFTCFKYKKGYRVEGADLVCNECSLNFRLADERWDNSRGCSPILIKSRLQDKTLVLQTSDLEKGAKLF